MAYALICSGQHCPLCPQGTFNVTFHSKTNCMGGWDISLLSFIGLLMMVLCFNHQLTMFFTVPLSVYGYWWYQMSSHLGRFAIRNCSQLDVGWTGRTCILCSDCSGKTHNNNKNLLHIVIRLLFHSCLTWWRKFTGILTGMPSRCDLKKISNGYIRHSNEELDNAH